MSNDQLFPLHTLKRQLSMKKSDPLWTIEEGLAQEAQDVVTAVPSLHCCKDEESRKGVCCKESNQEKDRFLLNPKVIRDVIIGLSDGLTVSLVG